MEFHLVDVFSPMPYSGNSLAVFPDARGLTAEQMLRVTPELRHFEAIFLFPSDTPNRVTARIFDLFEELPFAGHPVIGAAAVLHRLSGLTGDQTWQFDLAVKTVTVATHHQDAGTYGLLDQGQADCLGEIAISAPLLAALNLSLDDLDPHLPPETISTGLEYLIVPVKRGRLAAARITTDLTPLLAGTGARFAVLFDAAGHEVRHWNNDGVLEDVATGSAAGTIGAYSLKHGLCNSGDSFILNQGQYTGRPSRITVSPRHTATAIAVSVGGDVSFVGRGHLDVLP